MKHLARLFLSLMVILTMTIGNTYAISTLHPTQFTQEHFRKLDHPLIGFSSVSNHDKPILECDNEIEDDNDELIFSDATDKSLIQIAHNTNTVLVFVSAPNYTPSLNILYCVFRL